MSNSTIRDNHSNDNVGDLLILATRKLIEIFQSRLTITGYIRYFYEWYANRNKQSDEKKDILPRWFYTTWVAIWLVVIAIFTFYTEPHWIVAVIILYRLWEMLIVNIWLFFIYRQLGVGKRSSSNVFRIIVMLSWQYFTILMGYSVIYRTICLYYPESFKGLSSDTSITWLDTIFTWLYYSMATVTTFGVSDIAPAQHSKLAQLAVTSEVFLGILYVVLFIGSTIANLDISFTERENKKG